MNWKNLNSFPIGVYNGKNKPSNSNIFLPRFVEEIKNLQKSLYLHDKIKIKISKIICDAPAKSFILCIKVLILMKVVLNVTLKDYFKRTE